MNRETRRGTSQRHCASQSFFFKLERAGIQTMRNINPFINGTAGQAWINDRYMEVMETDADLMTPAERINILLLANSCPAALGNCVYTARSLCALLYPGMQYHDDLLCAAALPPSKQGQNPYQQENELLDQGSPANGMINLKPLFEFYPNPNYPSGELTVSYNLEGNQLGYLLIHDMLGKVIQKIELSPTVNKVTFKLAEELSNGTYLVELKQGNLLLAQKKLSLVQ